LNLRSSTIAFLILCFLLLPEPGGLRAQEVSWWLTKANGTSLLEKQTPLKRAERSGDHYIQIDTSRTFQTIEGFGYTLTGSSAILINALTRDRKIALLNELFGNGEGAISVSYLRISVGASDLNTEVFSYDDTPGSEPDTGLNYFSLAKDGEKGTGLIPLLHEIRELAPGIRIMASPWSPPAWMKDNKSTKGGSLLKEYYPVYARYLARYIKEMAKAGIDIHTMTPQNEPLHPGNNPSMYMTWEQQAEFIRDHLGPEFARQGLKTGILVYDHNCNKPDYPINILNDTLARKFILGSAFHLYEGEIEALSKVKQAHPDKDLYFTEQWTGSKGEFGGDLMWHMKNVIVGSMQNWSKAALEWNLANDPAFSMHSPGGCTECKGALTIDSQSVSRNVSYYIISHASAFVPPGSVRVHSTSSLSVPHVAFRRPDGTTALIMMNETDQQQKFDIRQGSAVYQFSLPAKAVVTMHIKAGSR
jgi:glucosylceramidase